jgi:hypothetical protein
MQSDSRIWRELSVDKDFADEWLERVNGLSCLETYSTCAGHAHSNSAGASDHARIWTRVKSGSLNPFFHHWKNDRLVLDNLLNRSFGHADTRYDAFLQAAGTTDHLGNVTPNPLADISIECSALWDKIWSDERTAAGLHLEHTIQRRSEDMPQEVNKWFETVTNSLVAFDKELRSIIARSQA